MSPWKPRKKDIAPSPIDLNTVKVIEAPRIGIKRILGIINTQLANLGMNRNIYLKLNTLIDELNEDNI